MRTILKYITLAVTAAFIATGIASAQQTSQTNKSATATQLSIKYIRIDRPKAKKAVPKKRKKVRRRLPANHDLWIRIGRCEQPGRGYMGINWSHHGPTYQGGLGFWYGTWASFKPRGYPANAGDATWRQQMVVANRLYARYGTTPWGCA